MITRLDWFKLHGFRQVVKPRLTDRTIRHTPSGSWRRGGYQGGSRESQRTAETQPAPAGGVPQDWHVPVRSLAGRPGGAQAGEPDGAGCPRLQARGRGAYFQGAAQGGVDVTHYHEYGIAKSKDLAADSAAKTKQRKWAGYERIYSNAIRHTGRHAMKGSGI